MQVTAWNNGSYHHSGAGYGIKISAADRDRNFLRRWKTVILRLEGEDDEVEINVDKSSFWGGTCRELISAQIGRWLIRNGLAPWPRSLPPKLELTRVADRRFVLRRSS